MNVQSADSGKVLRVLDIASFGRAGTGYVGLKRHYEKIWIAAFDTKCGSMNGDTAITDNITINKRHGILPEYLHGLNQTHHEYFDHVHFHMCYGGFGTKEMNVMLEDVGTIMRNDGYFFISADGSIMRCSTPKESILCLNGLMENKFQMVYRVSDEKEILPIVTQEALGIFALFDETLLNLQMNTREMRKQFIKLFSAFAGGYGDYIAIARKK